MLVINGIKCEVFLEFCIRSLHNMTDASQKLTWNGPWLALYVTPPIMKDPFSFGETHTVARYLWKRKRKIQKINKKEELNVFIASYLTV